MTHEQDEGSSSTGMLSEWLQRIWAGDRDTVDEKPRTWFWRDVALVCAMAAAVSIFLQWELFQQPDRFHDNWRQMPHFSRPTSRRFTPTIFFSVMCVSTAPRLPRPSTIRFRG